MPEYRGNPLWSEFKNITSKAGDQVVAKMERIGNLTSQADAIAEANFPDSARDASTKNAFRHALGTGMLTQELGGNAVSALAAKGAGYLWEGLGAADLWSSKDYREDAKHDLNANAVGAKVATKVANQQELVEALKRLANDSVVMPAPSVFSASKGRLTRTVQ